MRASYYILKLLNEYHSDFVDYTSSHSKLQEINIDGSLLSKLMNGTYLKLRSEMV